MEKYQLNKSGFLLLDVMLAIGVALTVTSGFAYFLSQSVKFNQTLTQFSNHLTDEQNLFEKRLAGQSVTSGNIQQILVEPNLKLYHATLINEKKLELLRYDP